MKRHRELPDDDAPMFHAILGTPDPDCPVCRAHGIELPEDAGWGLHVVDRIPFRERFRCPCPFCAEARKRMPEAE